MRFERSFGGIGGQYDGYQKGKNSIALENVRERALAELIIRVFAEEGSCLEGVYTVRRSEK